MHLKISHITRYRFGAPVHTGLQQLRMTPKATYNQTVSNWSVEVAGAAKQLSFTDQHRNQVDLISLDRDVTDPSVRSRARPPKAGRLVVCELLLR